MPMRTLVVLSLLSLVPAVTASAKLYWNGNECVECPEGFFNPVDVAPQSGAAATDAPSGGAPGNAGATFLDARLSELPDAFGRAYAPAQDLVTAPAEHSMLVVIAGPVKKVDTRSHKVVVHNRRQHKDRAVYVYDPIIHSLRERNVVEVWLKPDSDKAERITRLS
jgi:hypothetical protein